jgi:inner membrane protein YhjD
MDGSAWRARVLARVDAIRRRRPWFDIAFATVERFQADEASKLAALIAYYGFFSLFPLLLVFVTLVSFLLADHPEWQERLVDSALSQFPVIGDQLEQSIGELTGSGVTLLLSLAIALWSGLAVMQAIQDALAAIWRTPRERRHGFVRSHLRSLGMLVVIVIAVVATAVLTGLVALLDQTPVLAQVAVTVASFAVALTIFVVTFHLLTPSSPPVRELLPGAVLAAIGWIVLQLAGVWLVDRQLRNASALYGVFGVVLGLLSWLYLLAQISTIGAEVNATLRDRRAGRPPTQSSVGHPGTKVDQGPAQDA